jgi:hypothetical protein
MMLMVYIETICGVKIGREIRFEPLAPAGWGEYQSPILRVRGERFQVVVKEGQPSKVAVA